MWQITRSLLVHHTFESVYETRKLKDGTRRTSFQRNQFSQSFNARSSKSFTKLRNKSNSNGKHSWTDINDASVTLPNGLIRCLTHSARTPKFKIRLRLSAEDAELLLFRFLSNVCLSAAMLKSRLIFSSFEKERAFLLFNGVTFFCESLYSTKLVLKA